jgi:hypothetical protein
VWQQEAGLAACFRFDDDNNDDDGVAASFFSSFL